MQRQSVNSSNLNSIGFENGILEIEFNNGGLYQYNVPRSVYVSLMSADSHGKYFNTFIKNTYTPTKLR